MATNKCSYIVFSSDKSHVDENEQEITLFDCVITKNESPLFLGIRFDKNLSFKHQLNYLEEACMKRVNVLKVLSNKSWGLSIKRQTQVFNTLIRSLLEYSSIIYPCMSPTSVTLLERIQFKCLKIINRRSKFSANSEISALPNYSSIENRFDELNLSYLKKKLGQ